MRIKIRSPRCLRPGEDKNWEIFGKIVRIKNPDFGSFRLRHPSVLSGVLLLLVASLRKWLPNITDVLSDDR